MLTKEKKIILAGFAVIALVVGPVIVVNIMRFTWFGAHDPAAKTLHKVDTLSSEDYSVLSPLALTQIKLDFCWQNAYRNVAYLRFNQQYDLEITSDTLATNAPLPSLVHLLPKWSGETKLDIHTPVKLHGPGEFGFRLTPETPLQAIVITYYGDTITIIVSNDSVAHYRLLCEDLSIRHDIDSLADLGLTNGGGKSGPTINIDLILYKHQGRVFFLFFTPVDNGKPVEPILASKILRV